jgi:hypothetical protein
MSISNSSGIKQNCGTYIIVASSVLEQFILDLRFQIPLIQSVEVGEHLIDSEIYCVQVMTVCW